MENFLFEYIQHHIDLTEEKKEKIRNLILVKDYKKGSILLAQGHRSEDSYLVIKGCLRSYYLIDAEEKTTEFYLEQDVISPVCVVDGSPSPYYISCVEDCVLLISNPELEKKGFEEIPEFETLCRSFSDRQSAQNQMALDHFKLNSPEQRYLALLAARPSLFQRVPQHQLASYLGITPQSLSRLRKRILSK